MAKIRVYIQTWSEKQVEGKLNITNPIIEYLLDKNLGGDFVALHFEAPKTNGRPNKGAIISVCRGEVIQSKFDELAAIPGVTMLPTGTLDKLIGSFNTPTKNKIISALSTYSITPTIYDEAKTLGDFIRDVIADINPQVTSLGTWGNLNEWA